MKNLLGLSGKKQSGKDTIAKIIQYHTDKHPPNVTLEEFVDGRWWSLSLNTPTWEIKKYADKLKDIVCLLLGCTREQLEDNDFKEKELGEEWWYIKHYYPANPNHDKVFTLIPYIGFDSRMFDGDDCCLWETIRMTPRFMLQLLGTECGRQIIHPNLWVNSLFADYKPVCELVATGLVDHEDIRDNIYPYWLITDVRFENEVDAIKQRGGIVIRVNRRRTTSTHGALMLDTKDINKSVFVPYVEHPSETALDNYENFDYLIANDGDLKDLEKKVLVMMDYFEIPYNK